MRVDRVFQYRIERAHEASRCVVCSQWSVVFLYINSHAKHDNVFKRANNTHTHENQHVRTYVYVKGRASAPYRKQGGEKFEYDNESKNNIAIHIALN